MKGKRVTQKFLDCKITMHCRKIIFIVCEVLNFTCLNGGTCDDSKGYPICNCPSDKYGKNCEKTVGK